MKIKRYLNIQNITLILVVILLIQNFYLQSKVEETAIAASDAEYQASQARRYASDASDYASQAVEYASEAAEEAANASSRAYDAYANSFGYQCWSCP